MLINYLHVMTILPSSILVNEIYVVPFSRKFWSKTRSHKEEATETNNMSRLDGYLINTYAPLVTRKALYLIIIPIGMVSSIYLFSCSSPERSFV